MSFHDENQHLAMICHRIADGRRLARLLAMAVREHDLNETEFRLLWLLRETERTSLEQSVLVEELGISPAQVSALVEKLRSRQILVLVTDSKDRRRKLWRLTASCQEWLDSIIASVELLIGDWIISDVGDTCSEVSDVHVHSPMEDVA